MIGYKDLQYSANEINEAITEEREHCACRTNPHNVTAEQVGTYSAEQIDGIVGALPTTDETGIIRTAIGTECKNLLQNGCQNRDYAGVTCTVNPDGSITLNGENTNSIAYGVYYTNMRTGAIDSASQYDNYPLLRPGKYVASGGIDEKTDFQVCISDQENALGTTVSVGAGGEFTVPDGARFVLVRFRIKRGSTFHNETVFPMIRRAEITDETYSPYTPTLQQQIDEIRETIAAIPAAEGESF